jgi:hypothetical protein
MRIRNEQPAGSRRHLGGMTLVELMMALGVGMLTLSMVMSLYLFGLRSFGSMGNYTQMDGESRQTMDRMLREMREATGVIASQNTGATQWLTLICTNPAPVVTNTFTWDSTTGTMLWDKTDCPTVRVLTGCTRWSYEMFYRAPGTNYTFATTADPARCKLIRMSWTCVRTNTYTPINTENIVTAEVVLRNKH